MKTDEKIEYISEEGSGDAAKRIERLRKILKKCKSERQEYLMGWQRARADHQNYIKQKEREMADFLKFSSESSMSQIIPILDNLTLACESIPKTMAEDNWVKGIVQTRKHFESVLRENGVEAIEAMPGDKFDPAYHEAAGESAGSGDSGTVAEMLQRGYTLHGKVIRAARVKVIK